MTKGWKSESARHSMARRGLKTGRKQKLKKYIVLGGIEGQGSIEVFAKNPKQIIRNMKRYDEKYGKPTSDFDVDTVGWDTDPEYVDIEEEGTPTEMELRDYIAPDFMREAKKKKIEVK